MNKKAFFAVLISAIIAGSSGLFIKNVTIPATSIAAIRTGLPTLLMGLFLFFNGVKFFRGNYKLMLSGSVFNAIRMYFFFVAYIYTAISNAVIITFTWPIFATILSVIFLKEKVSNRNIALLLFSFLGIIIVFSNHTFSFENRDFIGMSAALATAITYAASIVIFKKGTANFSVPETIFYQNLVGMFVFFPFLLYHQPFPNIRAFQIISTYAILMGMISFSFFFYGLKRLQASTTSMLAYGEIISAFCFGFFFLGERLTWNMIIGGSIIVMTTILLRKT